MRHQWDTQVKKKQPKKHIYNVFVSVHFRWSELWTRGGTRRASGSTWSDGRATEARRTRGNLRTTCCTARSSSTSSTAWGSTRRDGPKFQKVAKSLSLPVSRLPSKAPNLGQRPGKRKGLSAQRLEWEWEVSRRSGARHPTSQAKWPLGLAGPAYGRAEPWRTNLRRGWAGLASTRQSLSPVMDSKTERRSPWPTLQRRPTECLCTGRMESKQTRMQPGRSLSKN